MPSGVYVRTDEARKNMSIADKGRCVGENHHLWGKHRSLESRRKQSETIKGENHYMWGKRGEGTPMWGKHHSPDVRKRISETEQCTKQNNPSRKGGRPKDNHNPSRKGRCSGSNHNHAWREFGKRRCEMCNMGIILHWKKYKGFRLHMHCLSEDYTIMKPENWLTVCFKCHGKLDMGKNMRWKGRENNHVL